MQKKNIDTKKMGFAEASAGDEGDHQVYAKEVADKKVIEVLFLKLSIDSKIGKFWTGLSAREAREQAEIVLEVAFGEGPNGLSPDDARYIHDAARGMKENDYDTFLKCFKDTLKEINKTANIIPKEKVDEAADNFNKFKKSYVK